MLTKSFKQRVGKRLFKDRYLILLSLLPVAYFIIFHYIPLYGLSIAFKNYRIDQGIIGSSWVGLKWFEKFFSSIYFGRLFKNTILISLYSIAFGFPIPIIFALLLNEMRDGLFKRFAQTASYLPYFISVVVIVGILRDVLSPTNGVVNRIIEMFGGGKIDFMNSVRWFRTVYVGSNIWQNFGFSSIIYLAALAGISPDLFDACSIDGANRLQRMRYVTIPSIAPTIITMLILRLGRIMNVGFQKVLLMYNPSIYEVADIFSTYVYRRGIIGAEFSYSAAVSVFNSLVNLAMVLTSNYIVKKLSNNNIF